MEKLQQIPDKLLLFALSLTSLIIYGYNQTDDMKTLATLCIGGLIGYMTANIKITEAQVKNSQNTPN